MHSDHLDGIFCYRIYNFIAWSRFIFFVSIFLIFISCIIITIFGFNRGLDFTGGMFIEITIDKDIDSVNIRNILLESGFKKIIIQRFGLSQDLIIKLPFSQNKDIVKKDIKRNIITDIFDRKIKGKFVVKQISVINPNVGIDFINIGMTALLAVIICILIYITWRFEWRSAIGTIISLAYDTLIIISILSIFAIEIDLTIIAALMSAIGYSLNDKIVIFDRIRENFIRLSEFHAVDIFNISLSQVLHRTIITSVTTVVVLLVLLIFGGSILYGFSITLLIGVIVGTISSICIASVLVFKLGMNYGYFIKTNKLNYVIYR